MDSLSLACGSSIRLGWNDSRPPAATAPLEERFAGASTAEGRAAANEEGFVTHTVSKRDTLAGLAIRYHVSPADIKRFNNMISDTDLYAHGKLLIPTKLLPLTEEARAIFVQIVARVGHPTTRFEARCSPEPVAASASCYAGSAGEDAPESPRHSTSAAAAVCRAHPHRGAGDVEMVDMSAAASSAALYSPGLRQPTDLNDQVRRRRTADAAEQRQPVDSCEAPRPPSSWGQQGSAFLTTVGKAFGDSGSVMMQKLPTGAQLSVVADSVMVSLRSGLLPKGNLPAARYGQEWLQASHVLPPASPPRPAVPQKAGKCD